MSFGNPCIKTGCDAVLHGQMWHGDLFDLGNYYILNCNGPSFKRGDIQTAHLKLRGFYSSHQEGKVLFISKAHDVDWFSYDGDCIDKPAEAIRTEFNGLRNAQD